MLFKVKEESECLSRNCLAGPTKPVNIKVEHVSVGSNKDGDLFLELEKPCLCCILPCCNRPTLTVYNIE